jgi:hypothetical protein
MFTQRIFIALTGPRRVTAKTIGIKPSVHQEQQ